MLTRPVFRYLGGKFRLSRWIIGYIQQIRHGSYIEPCGGAASVLLQKPRSALEIYNDLDGSVVNFFQVLRDRKEELLSKILLTPYARAEQELSFEPCDDPLEKARRFYVSVTMSISASQGYQPGFRLVKVAEQANSLPDLHPDNAIPALEFAAGRLSGVIIENLNALDCIRRYDAGDALIYFDPPYVASTRTHQRYALEVGEDFHIKAAGLLRQCRGYVMVSGYPGELYERLYEAHGWRREDRETITNGHSKRVESLWLSPHTIDALNGGSMQFGLFAHAGQDARPGDVRG